jgi:hypothetical protein
MLAHGNAAPAEFGRRAFRKFDTVCFRPALFIFLGSTAERITALAHKGREFISKLLERSF